MQDGQRADVRLQGTLLLMLAALLLALPASGLSATVRVGVYANEPKLMLGTDGRLSGIFGELLQEIADREQWLLQPVGCAWEACLELLEDSAIDLLPDVAINADRASRFSFHQRPALHSWSQIFSATASVYTSPTQLSGTRIAVLGNSIQQGYLEELASGFGLDIDILTASSFEMAFDLVRSGAADLAVSNHLYGNLHAVRYGLHPTTIIFQPSRLFFAAPPDSGQAMLARIDDWLERWTAAPESPYYAIMQRWGSYSAPQARSPLLLWGAIVLGILLLLVLAIALRLNRQVKHRSAALAESRYRLRETLNFDRLTGLPNRHQLLERLKKCLIAARHGGRDGAVLHIDLDNFRDLNDAHGHETGDLLLSAVAERLLDLPIRHFTAARVDGDSFILLIEGLPAERAVAQQRVEEAVQSVQQALQASFQLHNTAYHGSACIGVVMFSDVGYDARELLKSAELAMYEAKADGRDSLRFFNADMQDQVHQRAELASAIYRALENDEFTLWYQPQYDAQGKILGMESLVRWEHPVKGVIMPGVFIPASEANGLILRLGNRILFKACTQLAAWSTHPLLGGLTVAVNVSASQLHNDAFVDDVCRILDETGANANLLELELTETLLVRNVEEAIVKMGRLRERGVRFSLDDFGTGYSSMNYLKRLPLEKLKIDRSFVRDLLTDPNDAAIVRTIVALGESLGLAVIAEGVETAAQRDMLATSGCCLYQGYLFSHPVPAAELEAGMTHTP
ncbi:putative bifunctional diguanylate cyclase/phosphodiesterase [Chromatocurvus halotolerans]|uniref:cyclic-guanylate-specific phosphodiesterase n=1 Tax=Chromatocurvus halotolerans TaxID=1132028 RepID=A0A4R2KFZ2_9GAMM|nr:EAL domain-containing protein [Chromatocurvus halotolerans]TCO72631.1 diguanylate cyclase (GGDEF)-like protein [Chromatocurvus halotolerans]